MPCGQVGVLVLADDQEPLCGGVGGLCLPVLCLQGLHGVQRVGRAGPVDLDRVKHKAGFMGNGQGHHGQPVLGRGQLAGLVALPKFLRKRLRQRAAAAPELAETLLS